MKQFSLKLITATVAVIIAVLSYGLMAFGTGEKGELTQELHWYFNEGNNSYTYLGQGVTPPDSETCPSPTSEVTEICMKGLSTNPPANTVNDGTPAVEEIPREPLSN